MTEVEKINQVVDEFAKDMKVRLLEKHNKGYRGWDGEYPEEFLTKELVADAKDVQRNIPLNKFNATLVNILNKRLVDVGARAMMVWFRYNNLNTRKSLEQPIAADAKKSCGTCNPFPESSWNFCPNCGRDLHTAEL